MYHITTSFQAIVDTEAQGQVIISELATTRFPHFGTFAIGGERWPTESLFTHWETVFSVQASLYEKTN